MPAGVRIGQRVVHDMAVAVVFLQVVGELHVGVGLQEPGEARVVDALVTACVPGLGAEQGD